MSRLEFDDFKYLFPKELLQFMEVQVYTYAYCGICDTISMMYLHLIILNSYISQKKLVKFLIRREKEKLKSMILKYAKHVENTLKYNEDYILELFEEVIEEIACL